MAGVLTLADFRPSPRVDGVAWTKVRIEESDDPAEAWSEVEIADLEPVDEDPAKPVLRSITTVEAAKEWVRLVFLDADGNEDTPSPMAARVGLQFRPTATQIAGILRARTYSGQEPDPENPMEVLAGGKLLGEFTDKTVPTLVQVEGTYIPDACVDVHRALGYVPGELLDDARRAAAMRCAAEIERAYIPEQSDEGRTIYQTLRMTASEDVEKLVGNLRLWLWANRGIQ